MTGATGYSGANAASPPRRRVVVRVSSICNGLLYLTSLSGFMVLVEPAPYDLLVILTLGVFSLVGITWVRQLNPLAMMLFLYHLGACMSLILVIGLPDTLIWTLVGIFLAIGAIGIAAILQTDTLVRADLIFRAWVVGAVICSIIGTLAYFHAIPSAETFLRYSRVKSTFKDPNVFGPFLILPAVWLVQRIYTATMRQTLRLLPALGIIFIGIFLSFSRGAWGHLVASVMLMTLLCFMLSNSAHERARIVFLSAMGVVATAAMVAVLLSFDVVSQLFAQRAELEQSYDSGAMGRFGRHVFGFILSLDHPLGIGMLQFKRYAPEDPHNTFLNAFLSYGWLGGAVFPALVGTTLYIGFKAVKIASPWRPYLIAALSTYTVVMIEAWIIDIDHWRHVYLLLALVWGLSAASVRWDQPAIRVRPKRQASPTTPK